jgi:hypothetical protein
MNDNKSEVTMSEWLLLWSNTEGMAFIVKWENEIQLLLSNTE